MNLHVQFKNMVDPELYSINQHLEKYRIITFCQSRPIAIVHHLQNDNNENVKLTKEHVMEFIRDYGPGIEEDDVETTTKELQRYTGPQTTVIKDSNNKKLPRWRKMDRKDKEKKY
ncbi:hypothetical protein INT45_002066 [Circinella minor]|uniref:Uncharacterized protein n=1 Tax=Circinella minor TaxID=1195481 RepID=A0A8H7VT52_9FUNG|nr:hypothetical protein INT45_002066 [Circinella minor]